MSGPFHVICLNTIVCHSTRTSVLFTCVSNGICKVDHLLDLLHLTHIPGASGSPVGFLLPIKQWHKLQMGLTLCPTLGKPFQIHGKRHPKWHFQQGDVSSECQTGHFSLCQCSFLLVIHIVKQVGQWGHSCQLKHNGHGHWKSRQMLCYCHSQHGS